MKVVIFAGGLGTRLMEETDSRPKPMVEIGGKPILWHIMKMYGQQGFNDFIICLGYKGNYIREYFLNYYLYNSDIRVNVSSREVSVLKAIDDKFNITLVDTGLMNKTAGRLQRVKEHVGKDDFMLTYGDGVSDIDLKALAAFHKKHGKIATVTAVQPEARFGGMLIKPDTEVEVFKEKPSGDGNWKNGGFFVLKNEVFSYLGKNADEVMWEEEPLEKLAGDKQLFAYKHKGFWKCMDALRDKIELEELWASGKAKWKTW